MENWKRCTLADLGEIVGGATPSTKNESYYGGDIAWITPKDLSIIRSRFISRGERNITVEGLKNCSARLMPPHSVLFTSRAPIGYVAIAENEVCTNQGFKSVVPNADTDYLFLYYLLMHNREKIENMGSGTTFKEVSGSVMKQIEVFVPSDKAEQQSIAEILGTLDDKIENNTKINNYLEQMAQVIYADFVADAVGKIIKLGDICTFQEGYVNPTQSRAEYFDGDVKWLRAVDINESFIFATTRSLTKKGFDSAGKSALLFRPDTIAISKSGTIGRLGFVADFMCGNRAVINIAPRDNRLLPFVYLYLKSRQAEYPNLAVGSVQKNLYISILQDLDVIFPDEEQALAFSSGIKPMFDQWKANVAENIKLVSLRDTLLPRLMSGELSVAVSMEI